MLNITIGKCQISIYQPFPDSNAFWCETNWWLSSPTPPYCFVTDNYCLFINGDTIINAMTYHKIFQSGYISASCPPPGYNYYNNYEGAIRQDVLLKKVFFILPSNANEELLYDFNLGIGDTLQPSINTPPDYNYISSIDSVLVGSQYHKRFLLNNLNDTNYAIIEGLGSTFGLFHKIVLPFESGSQLNCFNNEGNIYPVNSSCLFNIGIFEINKSILNIKIFPNPLISESKIISDYYFKNATIIIYNSYGEEIRQVNNFIGQEIVIHRRKLISGVYYLKIIEDSKIISINKLLIVD